MFACNGILFNHESPIRGETFVTRKITRAAARIAGGIQDCLYLGNLDSLRDWGHARDYVRAQWLMLQQDRPDDYVVATGQQHSVRDFCDNAFARAGIRLAWKGSGIDEQGVVDSLIPDAPLVEKYGRAGELKRLTPGRPIIFVDPSYFRPADVVSLIGDAAKAHRELGWVPEISFDELVEEMVDWDFREACREAVCRASGYPLPDSVEERM
jgi:GDPmannose 4,6-dehydratase